LKQGLFRKGDFKMPKQLLDAGKIVAIHALAGEMRVQSWCDSPDLFCELPEFFLDGSWYEVVSARPHKNIVLLKLQGIDTPEQAQKLVGKVLQIRRDMLELPEDTYFVADLIGMQVVDADDPSVVYGQLVEVSNAGASDLYHIRFADGKIRLAPAIAQVVIRTDIEAGVMEIRPLEGLFDDAL
jgi:16S rRNA processing protein RimM